MNTDLRRRIKRVEAKAGAGRQRRVEVFSLAYGEDPDQCLHRHEVQAEDMDLLVFITRFTDPANPHHHPAPDATPRVATPPKAASDLDGEIQGLLRELEASGVSPAEIQAALEGKTALAAPEEEVPDACLSPECLEERRRLDQLWASHEVRGAGHLRPPEELRADDLVALSKRRRH